MAGTVDVVIVGGAVMGAAAAYFLAARGLRVMMIERDPSFATCSTALSASSIRHQFSTPLNVQISLFGTAFLREMGARLAIGQDRPDPQFHEAGYLYLAATEAQARALRANHAVQRAAGAEVVLLSPEELGRAYPHLNTADLRLAALGLRGEGWFSSTALMDGLRARARADGALWQVGEVCGIDIAGGRVTGVRLRDGTRIGCGWLVNAAGPRAAHLAALAGLVLPVEPRKRTNFLFSCPRSPEGSARVHGGRLPLMIDIHGTFVRPEGRFFLAGTTPDPDPAVAPDDFEPRYDEFDRIWHDLAARAPAFEAIRMERAWAGHYAWNRLDQNAVVGPHPDLPNFLFMNGFSGHGLQQAPAMGRGIAEWIATGGWQTLDLSPLGYARIPAARPYAEGNVI